MLNLIPKNNSVNARLAAMVASVNADPNATAEEREMAKQAEATLARRAQDQVTSRTIAANHNRLGDDRNDGPRMDRS